MELGAFVPGLGLGLAVAAFGLVAITDFLVGQELWLRLVGGGGLGEPDVTSVTAELA